ncbi:MAG TPA: hypothetical protein VNE42_07480 [Acidimicrobiales bacterium]|nr:hypothetical protein [Acidimicrobiales bacterium]
MRPDEDLFPDYTPKRNRTHKYGEDREMARRPERPISCSPIYGVVGSRDLAMIKTMGGNSKHQEELFGASDLGTINFGRRPVGAVTDFVASVEPSAFDRVVDCARVRALGALIPRGDIWRPVAWSGPETGTSSERQGTQVMTGRDRC